LIVGHAVRRTHADQLRIHIAAEDRVRNRKILDQGRSDHELLLVVRRLVLNSICLIVRKDGLRKGIVVNIKEIYL